MTKQSENFIGYIFEDTAGNIWLSESDAHGNMMNLNRYDQTGITKIASEHQIFGITEDNDGNIWFGTENGASRYDGISITNFTD